MLITCRSKVQGPPYKGGRVTGFTTCTESHLDTESYSKSWPSKLELQVVLGLLLDGSLLCLGPWSACLQPSPCDLMRDSALAFLVLAGLLSGSMGLPIKYPPISSPRIYLGRSFDGFLQLLGSTPWFDFSNLSHRLRSRLLLAPR